MQFLPHFLRCLCVYVCVWLMLALRVIYCDILCWQRKQYEQIRSKRNAHGTTICFIQFAIVSFSIYELRILFHRART